MPSAPKSRESCASAGLSALARTPRRRILVGPLENGVEVAGELRHNQVDGAQNDDAGGTVERNHVTLVNHDISAGERGFLLLGVNLELLNAADARGTHATGDNGSMRWFCRHGW